MHSSNTNPSKSKKYTVNFIMISKYTCVLAIGISPYVTTEWICSVGT